MAMMMIAWKKQLLSNQTLISSTRFYSKSAPQYVEKVGIVEFLNGIGKGVETHCSKLETKIGDFHKLLVTRTLNIKKLGIPIKHVEKDKLVAAAMSCKINQGILLNVADQRTLQWQVGHMHDESQDHYYNDLRRGSKRSRGSTSQGSAHAASSSPTHSSTEEDTDEDIPPQTSGRGPAPSTRGARVGGRTVQKGRGGRGGGK